MKVINSCNLYTTHYYDTKIIPRQKAKDVVATIPSNIKDYLLSLFPILQWLPKYNRQWLYGDLVAAITIGCIVIPQGMAYAKVSLSLYLKQNSSEIFEVEIFLSVSFFLNRANELFSYLFLFVLLCVLYLLHFMAFIVYFRSLLSQCNTDSILLSLEYYCTAFLLLRRTSPLVCYSLFPSFPFLLCLSPPFLLCQLIPFFPSFFFF